MKPPRRQPLCGGGEASAGGEGTKDQNSAPSTALSLSPCAVQDSNAPRWSNADGFAAGPSVQSAGLHLAFQLPERGRTPGKCGRQPPGALRAATGAGDHGEGPGPSGGRAGVWVGGHSGHGLVAPEFGPESRLTWPFLPRCPPPPRGTRTCTPLNTCAGYSSITQKSQKVGTAQRPATGKGARCGPSVHWSVCHSATERRKVPALATTWTDLEHTPLGKGRQTQATRGDSISVKCPEQAGPRRQEAG